MHVAYADIIRDILEGNWGNQCHSKEEAAETLVNNEKKLTAFAMIEVLRRLDAIGQACGSKQDKVPHKTIELTGNEKPFPSKNVGDRLYYGCLEDGFDEYVVIAKDESHRCLVVELYRFSCEWPPVVRFANGAFIETMAEAVRLSAKEDIRYYRGRLEHAKAALAAVRGGEDLSRFAGGYDYEEDQDNTSA